MAGSWLSVTVAGGRAHACFDGRLDLLLHRTQVEAGRGLHRGIVDGGFPEHRHDILDEHKPRTILSRAFTSGASACSGSCRGSKGALLSRNRTGTTYGEADALSLSAIARSFPSGVICARYRAEGKIQLDKGIERLQQGGELCARHRDDIAASHFDYHHAKSQNRTPHPKQ